MTLDYEVYADGEALLGWLNATVTLTSTEEFDANAYLTTLAADVQQSLEGMEIAHFKMTFSPNDGLAGELASINLVRSDYVPELGMPLEEDTSGGQLIINLRAEGEPVALLDAVNTSLKEINVSFPSVTAALDHEEHFRPGKPTPTHRNGEAPGPEVIKGGCRPGSGCC